MKVNLLLDNPGDVRNGYLNIDPFTPETATDSRIRGDVSNIDAHVDGGEADEIVALDILDYFPANAADDILNNWLSKLAHGGTLTVSTVDLREVAKGVVNFVLSIEDANELLMGRQAKSWQFKKSAYTLSRLVEVLRNRGYIVLARRVQNYRAVVTVQRP